MGKQYSLKDNGTFIINDYNRAKTFSSFLPGIAGVWGIPLWVFYVNRAQGVVSFGIKDKNHSISEFFPANKAYSLVSSFGFRTFLKINKKDCYEPFRSDCLNTSKQQMQVESASFQIEDVSLSRGLKTAVRYFTLPNTAFGSLVRVVTIKNITKKKINLEVIDGLSRIVPFGSIHPFLKDMSRTLEAWMQSSVENNLATFKLIVDPRDVSQTKYIEGANFNFSFYEDKGKKIAPYMIVDPSAVFGYDHSHSLPTNFLKKDFRSPLTQIYCGRMPCAFSYFKWTLNPGQERTFFSLFGATFKSEQIKKFVKTIDAQFLNQKEIENKKIIEDIKNNSFCMSGSGVLNNYIKSTYLDNVMRGGYPYRIGQEVSQDSDRSIYYIYSRKHGDLERDYNNFNLLPTSFSEGEANYRDINQNRRMDLFYEPSLGAKNIKYFLNFIKIDGYNPLILKGEKLRFEKEKAKSILTKFGIKDQKLYQLMLKGFYLGEFFKLLEEEKIKITKKHKLVQKLLEGPREPVASHGEGYWIDHWHYNLDSIDSFLSFYPDRLKELFLDEEFIFWDDYRFIKPRHRRYCLKGAKVYQSEALEVSKEKKAIIKSRATFKNSLRTKEGKIYKTNLIEKLLSLILNKSATLDPEGIGIEMEADKPGWCDSLNGLPALFGSSVCETYEVKRMALILLEALSNLKGAGVSEVRIADEVFSFYRHLNNLLNKFLSSKSKVRDYFWWDRANSIKEDFRQKTYFCISANQRKLLFVDLEKFLKRLITKLDIGLKKAKDKKSKLPFTYFTYTAKKYEVKDNRIIVNEFLKKPLPLYLEGPMHALRVEAKKDIHKNIKASKLFDKKLKMYKLNVSLDNESLEIGRSRVFIPGWLENESIWLHMQYKYMLELLKNGLYNEFFEAFHNCGVCFLDPKTYGRSPLENSSFIVSSSHPDKNLWGRGFVARLSGATAEFINMWIVLCLGRKPFILDKKTGLCLKFSPILEGQLFTTKSQTVELDGQSLKLPKNSFSFKLFSKTLVCYHNPKRKDTFSKSCRIDKIVLTQNGRKIMIPSGIIGQAYSLAVRNSQIERIDVYFI